MRTDKRAWEHLALDDVMKPYFADPGLYLTEDPEEIRLRQRELTAFLRKPVLGEVFVKLSERFAELDAMRSLGDIDSGDPLRTIRTLDGLDSFRKSLDETVSALEHEEQFRGELEAMRELLQSYPADFAESWDRYAEGVQFPESLTYRFKLDPLLNVRTYRLTSVREKRFPKPIKLPIGAQGQYRVKTKYLLLDPNDLIRVRKNVQVRTNRAIDDEEEKLLLAGAQSVLPRMLKESAKSAAVRLQSLARTLLIQAEPLRRRVNFFVGAAAYIRDLRAVSDCIFPEIAASGGSIRGLSHPRMLLRKEYCVPGDVDFDESGLQLLMGANRGGKTTYLRAVGAAQLLFQMGLPIPAASARISPVSQVLCVFATEERTGFQSGRLGQELNALREAIVAADEHTLILFNEPLTGASKRVSEALCREFLSILKVKGVRGLWVTHLFAMIRDAEAMNGALPGQLIGFLHVLPHGEGGFRVMRGVGDGMAEDHRGSHARELLAEEGVEL